MKLYKLTDENAQTYAATQWGEGVTHEAVGNDAGLCSNGFIHAYESVELAVLMNPIHGNFESPRLWEADGEITIREGQLKCGCKKLTTVREIPLPSVTTEQRVKFALYCALKVYNEPSFVKWANDWLENGNRLASAAVAAALTAMSAKATAAAAAWKAAKVVSPTARAAACVAERVARTEEKEAEAAVAAAMTAAAVEHAKESAQEAAMAAREARAATPTLDFLALARKALQPE